MSRVSVVVITRNRGIELTQSLGRLEAFSGAAEIIVVDNASTDDTAARVASAHPRVRLIRLSENRGAAGRNVGVAAARTQFVAFSDDDSWWSEDAFERAVHLFDTHPRLAVLATRILVGPSERLDPTCTAMARSPLARRPDLPGPSVLGFVACGAIVRREAFLAVGGFPSRYGVGGEEAPVALALAGRGWGLAYADGVVAHHHPSSQRDSVRRGVIERRNELWTAWSRLPASAAVKASWHLVRHGWRDRSVRRGTLHALRGLPGSLADRRAVPPAIAREWQLLTARSDADD